MRGEGRRLECCPRLEVGLGDRKGRLGVQRWTSLMFPHMATRITDVPLSQRLSRITHPVHLSVSLPCLLFILAPSPGHISSICLFCCLSGQQVHSVMTRTLFCCTARTASQHCPFLANLALVKLLTTLYFSHRVVLIMKCTSNKAARGTEPGVSLGFSVNGSRCYDWSLSRQGLLPTARPSGGVSVAAQGFISSRVGLQTEAALSGEPRK